MKCDVLIVPGLWNSGPRHWQSLWHERYPQWLRAQHRDWTNPDKDEWVAELDAAVAACKGAPIPMEALPFPSIVLASSDDPYATPERSRALAGAWGSRFVDIGKAGHLNTESGHGAWLEGERLLNAFCDQVSR